MTHRERIARIYAGQSVDRAGFWLGNPHPELLKRLLPALGVDSEEALRCAVDDDCRWYPGNWLAAYRHPEGKPMWDFNHGREKTTLSGPGCFADTEEVTEVEAYPWPDAAYLDLAPLREAAAQGVHCWRWGGAWSSFFHEAAEFFGMENYFMKMYTDPAVVHAVTRGLVDFYLACNARIFREAPETLDALFMGNDFGTQEAMLVSPQQFREFILPYYRELIAQATAFGVPTQLHSCGAVFPVIRDLLDAGITALHPLQAKARGMDAASLMREYGGQLTFVGGVDTQQLMWRGTPQQIKDEVNRLHDIFGDRWIISPSHEVLMPEVPVENVLALCEAATGKTLA